MTAALAIERRNTWRDNFGFSVFNGIAWTDQFFPNTATADYAPVGRQDVLKHLAAAEQRLIIAPLRTGNSVGYRENRNAIRSDRLLNDACAILKTVPSTLP